MITLTNRTEGTLLVESKTAFGFVLSTTGTIIGVYLSIATSKYETRKYLEKPSYVKKSGKCRLYVIRQFSKPYSYWHYTKHLKWVPVP